MKREIIADVNPHEARVALLEDGELAEIQVEFRGNERLVGNIYKGRVENILPGMQAAFVDVGLEKNAFLYAGDILADKSDFEFPGERQNVDRELKNTNIKYLLKQNQEIMVQVLKQPGGTKGARVTTHITLPGRMIVLMPTVDHVGVSRRIGDEAERERLKQIMEKYKPEGMGIIVRTAAVGCSEEKLAGEVNFLARLWGKVQDKADFVSAPRLIHSEETLLFRTVRDMFTEDVDRFVINDKDYFEKVQAVVEITTPALAGRVEHFSKPDNIFDLYNIEAKVDKALSKKVWLDNGVYLYIEETEALTVVDVNTGKYVGEDDLQETIVNTNIEAAREIARQLRLRDIGGMVVIDFVDMEGEENEARVVAALEEALKADRTKTNVVGFTGLGLVEMTRKKVRRKLSALLLEECKNCGSSGKVFAPAAMAMRVRREVNRYVLAKEADRYLVEVAPATAKYIEECNNQNQAILRLYEGKQFYLKGNRNLAHNECKISVILDEKGLNGAQIFC